MQILKKSKKCSEVEFETISDHWCMQIFRAFECTLHEFQPIVVLSCAAQPISAFLTVYYLTLKEYRSARNPSCHLYNWWLCKLSQVEFLTSFIKTFMIKHLRTNHTSDLHFTKISTFTALNNFGLVRIVCQNG